MGNLVDDPELRFTPAGQPVAQFRDRQHAPVPGQATGEWKDGESAVPHLRRVAPGRRERRRVHDPRHAGDRDRALRQRSYETKEGEKRTVYELEVDEVGPSLRNASAKVSKVTRTSGGEAQASRQGGGKDADPWASEPAPAYSDEPPF